MKLPLTAQHTKFGGKELLVKEKQPAKSFSSKVIAGSPNSQRMPTVKLPI
jgi:hypothetical protein